MDSRLCTVRAISSSAQTIFWAMKCPILYRHTLDSYTYDYSSLNFTSWYNHRDGLSESCVETNRL